MIKHKNIVVKFNTNMKDLKPGDLVITAEILRVHEVRDSKWISVNTVLPPCSFCKHNCCHDYIKHIGWGQQGILKIMNPHDVLKLIGGEEIRYQRVNSIKHLKELTTGKNMEFYLILSNGRYYSKKTIQFVEDESKFHVYNYFDDTEQMLGPRQIFNKEYTNIGEAIRKGAFVYEEKANKETHNA